VTLPVFGFVTRHVAPLADGVLREAQWMEQCAVTGRAVAHLWSGAPGLVVPHSYTRLEGWPAARERWAAMGRPALVRASGGGLVPLGPGVLNLSLVWCSHSAEPVRTDQIYRSLCDGLATALRRLGVVCEAAEVPGSYCDGRFNLAAGGRKLAGTAQSWRRIGGQPVVLAHAMLITTAEPDSLTAEANAFEQALGSDRHYRAEALTSIAHAWMDAHRASAPPPDIDADVRRVVAEQFARVVPPRVNAT